MVLNMMLDAAGIKILWRNCVFNWAAALQLVALAVACFRVADQIGGARQVVAEGILAYAYCLIAALACRPAMPSYAKPH